MPFQKLHDLIVALILYLPIEVVRNIAENLIRFIIRSVPPIGELLVVVGVIVPDVGKDSLICTGLKG
jgi:hypothetical protein